MGRLQQKVAVITGASTGIGKSIAIAFADEGAKVVLASRSREKLEAAAKEIRSLGGTALVIPTNVVVEADVENLFHQIMEDYGRVDILVNNAGITTKTPTDELTLETWQSVLDVNLTGAFLCSRAALKIMKQQRSGRIINIGSVSAKVPRPHSAPYVTSKFGLEGFTRSLALDGREHGISVCILHPGNTATPIWQGREEQAQKEGVMSADDLARVALAMATLPPDVSMLESIVLPMKMPFLGRG
ncbi:MAG: SDR family oxidoreductase [Deltaproteobacteria bacterium]|nr:SDR family oxidoreductase [Deltaproteobacteria bacterium]MBW1994970.1 SDR family oxidoreductase [Deltaproteobacteria bacterium]MBW2152252.1 SDR family oxidoreductase [Deltaproteobacteria bacterium]